MRRESQSRPRYAPNRPFPPYSYVPGRFPHPLRDRAGHSYATRQPPLEVPVPENWRNCQPYLYGIDLFNHGYYWEAHEVWEGLWHACGRAGAAGSFLKGLIKLAAAGVKAREGNPNGVVRHARRAAELFAQTLRSLPEGETTFFGLELAQLTELANAVVAGRRLLPDAADDRTVAVVFDFVLRPGPTRHPSGSA